MCLLPDMKPFYWRVTFSFSIEKQARKFKLFMENPLPGHWQNRKLMLVLWCSSPWYLCQPCAMFRLMKHRTISNKLIVRPRPTLGFQGRRIKLLLWIHYSSCLKSRRCHGTPRWSLVSYPYHQSTVYISEAIKCHLQQVPQAVCS